MSQPIRPRQSGYSMWPLAAIGIFVLAIVATAAFTAHVFTGDPALFADRMRQLFSGKMPYTGFEYEHLPLAVVPMALAYLVDEALGSGAYNLVFGAVSLVGVLLTAAAMQRAGERLGSRDGASRWLILVLPMAPIVIFRVDIWSVLAVAIGLAWLFGGRRRAVYAFGAGVALKGWPVVTAAVLWWRGHRGRAVGLVLFAIVLVGALGLTEGFRAGRSFVGVHQETLTGSVVMLGRALRGVDLGLTSTAGALYISVGRWAVLGNVLIGATVGITAIRALKSTYAHLPAIRLSGGLTGALMLASPLLSAQFLLWLTPFVALDDDRANDILLIAAGACTTLLLGMWHPTRPWWPLVLVVRNALLLALVARLAVSASRTATKRSEPSQSSAEATVVA